MSNPRLGLPSASGATRRRRCLGSWNLEQATPPDMYPHYDPSVTLSEEGELLHESWEYDDPNNLTGDQMITFRHGMNLRQEMINIALEEGLEMPYRTVKERRVWLSNLGEKLLSGRFDFLAMSERVMLVLDYKAGWKGAGDAAENSQLLELAVCLYVNFPQMEKIIVGLIQPKLPQDEQLSYHIFDRAELRRQTHRVLEHLELIKQPDQPLQVGAWCNYCRAINVCPAQRKMKDELVTLSGRPTNLMPQVNWKLLQAFKGVETFIEKQRELAKSILSKDPDAIPGVTLKPGQDRRDFDSYKASKILMEHIDDAGNPLVQDTEEILRVASLSIKAIMGFIKSKYPDLKGKALDEKFNELMGEVIETKQTAPSLVLDDYYEG